jgi:ankyrin repeat protein
MLACEHGDAATAELLIAKGADVHAKDKARQGVVLVDSKRNFGRYWEVVWIVVW